MQNKRITIKSIANELGVSEGTVDRALHNRRRISGGMRTRVLEKARELGYQPNMLARTLGRNKTLRVAVLLPEYVEFWEQMREGARDAVAEWEDFNIEVLLCENYNENNITGQLSILDGLQQDSYDGVIVTPFSEHIFKRPINRIVSNGIPVVTVNRDCPESDRMCYVGENAFGLGFTIGAMYARLLNVGDTCGVLSIDTREDQIDLRTSGFINAIKSNSGNITLIKKRYELTRKSVFDQIADMVREHRNIKSLFVNTSEGANWAAMAKRELGLSFVLSGIDVTEECLMMIDDGLMDFTVSQNPYLQGYSAVSILIGYLIRGKTPRNKLFFTSTDIIMDRRHYMLCYGGTYNKNFHVNVHAGSGMP
ncbi:MAG: substrate-binding domain-containing protein [Oscillospiraceae bacterium]|nr:substrate-binding domain-containing protein [Oscillospiraceae bacterium]